MSLKNLCLVIDANQAYMRNIDPNVDFSLQNEVLFSAMTDTYIPLLNLFTKLESENIPFKVGLVISSQLAQLLSDQDIQNQYIDFLDRSIALGQSEIKRTKGTEFYKQVEATLENFQKTKNDFITSYAKNLAKAFAEFARKDLIELIPTAATYAYLPHIADLPEALNAQVETGLYSQRLFFNETGEGFFLPFLGYTEEIDKVLRSYNRCYTIVDPRSILFCNDVVNTGIFRPVLSENSLVLLANDLEAVSMITGEEGFITNEVYRSPAKDIGFELDLNELKPFLGKSSLRSATLYRYWKKGFDDPGEEVEVYEEDEAFAQARKDAETFVQVQSEKIAKAADFLSGISASSVCVLPAELLGGKWHEGIVFFEEVIRRIAQSEKGITLELCRNLISDGTKFQKIKPLPSAGDESGYGENMLDASNSWMFRYIRKATERMIDIADRLPSETSLKGRLMNLAAKEILLAQSGQWLLMLHDGKLTDYVTESFKKQVLSFTTVFNALASNTVSTEWLTKKERQDAIYPWMNYRIFSKKK